MSVFLNMTTNSRGMLVIGLAVATLVLGGFSALYSTGNEKAMGTGKSIDGQLRDQRKEIDLLQTVIRERTKQLKEAEHHRVISREADEITARIQANRLKISELEKRIPALSTELEAGLKALEDEKGLLRRRLLADPSIHSMPELRTVSGRTYREVRLTSIDASSITFSHQEGSSRVFLKDLPLEIRNRFP